MQVIDKIGLGVVFFSIILVSPTLSPADTHDGAATDVGTGGPVLALSTGAPTYNNTGVQIGQKFIRGMANTFTGWVEMPKQMYLRTSKGPLVIGVVQGILEGIGMSLARTSAGLYDIATFPVPLPWHYGPILEPEYVWQDEEPDEVLSLPGLAPPAVPHGLDEQNDPMADPPASAN
ncbi:MAG: exosortase system-associated protein, TIGR04073 family [Nitrospiria bacterium]